MSKFKRYIKIKDKEIPIVIRNYKKFNKIKIFFRGNILNVSKPRLYSINKVIRDYGNEIYDKYLEIISIENSNIKHFIIGEKIFYKGEFYTIDRQFIDARKICISFDDIHKTLNISLPINLKNETEIRDSIINCIKKIFRNDTSIIIQKKLQKWSKKMNLEYASFKVNDTSSKYGSCMPKSKKLFFSLKLIMLPDDIIDLIVVHELAHLVHPNHSEDFYDLVKKYISDYDRKNKWLKENSNLIML